VVDSGICHGGTNPATGDCHGGATVGGRGVKAALCYLADLIETTTPQEILDSADHIELLGLHQDCELVSAYVGAIETLAGAAIKRAGLIGTAST
jgi:hypothetical protein